MQRFQQDHDALKQQIRKELWLPNETMRSFTSQLDQNMLNQKYGLEQTRSPGLNKSLNNLCNTKSDLRKYIQNQRQTNQQFYRDAHKDLVSPLTRDGQGSKISQIDKLERESELIWKDKQNKYMQQTRHENKMNSHVGNSAYNAHLQQQLEERFMNNLEQRRTTIQKNNFKAYQCIMEGQKSNDDRQLTSANPSQKPQRNALSQSLNTLNEVKSFASRQDQLQDTEFRRSLGSLDVNEKNDAMSKVSGASKVSERLSPTMQAAETLRVLVNQGAKQNKLQQSQAFINNLKLAQKQSSSQRTSQLRFNVKPPQLNEIPSQQRNSVMNVTAQKSMLNCSSAKEDLNDPSIASGLQSSIDYPKKPQNFIDLTPKQTAGRCGSEISQRKSEKQKQGSNRNIIEQNSDYSSNYIGSKKKAGSNDFGIKLPSPSMGKLAPLVSKVQPTVKFDATSNATNDRSSVTYQSFGSMNSKLNPSTAFGPSIATSKMALHCDFLAQELELEKQKRMRMENELNNMKNLVQLQQKDSKKEAENILYEKMQREAGFKYDDLDLKLDKNRQKGFVMPC